MPWLRVAEFDTGGSAGDLPPQSLPPQIFTGAQNVSFVDGAVEKVKGYSEQYGTPPVIPYYLLPSLDNAGNKRLFIASTATIYAYLSGSYTNVTRASGGAYSAGTDNAWTGGVLHGVPFLNNGVDAPQSWDSTTSKMVNLPNWPANHSAKALRAFKNYLVALNYSDGVNSYPHNVLWSHPADPGSVPSSWDIADTTKDAGSTPLSDTPGYVVDGLSLGDAFIVYKEDAMYLMQLVGAPFIFRFRPVIREAGVLTRNCIAEVEGRHAVLSTNDVLLFDGNRAESIINRRWRRDLFASISLSDFAKSFVVSFPDRRELWICVSTVSGYAPNIAYVWNWKTNTWSKRDLPFTQSVAYGPAADTATTGTWDSDAGSWDSDSEGWSAFSLSAKAGVIAGTADTKLFTVDVGETQAGTAMTASVERYSYDFANTQKPDPADLVKHISKVRPRILANNGVQLGIEIGTQMHIDDPISWGAKQTYTVGTTRELCLGANGRYISWRISSECDCTWRLEALDFLFQVGGRF